MSDDCLFCRIARGDIPASIVARNEVCLAFRDVAPHAPVHCLIIPREHVASLDSAHDASLLGELLLMAAQVAREEGVAESGYRVVANTNADAGQSVFHLHLHVLGGRKLDWPPG
jgi:histidine triad (HIT) family protein